MLCPLKFCVCEVSQTEFVWVEKKEVLKRMKFQWKNVKNKTLET